MEDILDSYFKNIDDITKYSRDQIYMDIHDEPEIMNSDYNKVMSEIDKRIKKLLPEVKGGVVTKTKLIISICVTFVLIIAIVIIIICLSRKNESTGVAMTDS